MTGEHKYIIIEEYNVHYLEVGEGDPIILIPGSFNTYKSFNRVIPFLSDIFRIIAVDYLGVGDSDKPKSEFEYTVKEQADIIAKLITKLELGMVNILGVSYGGAIALYLAAIYPNLIKSVISIEGGVFAPEDLPRDPMELLLKFPIVGDIFIILIKSGLLNKLVLKAVAGTWHRNMTVDDKRDVLNALQDNARTASRIPWFKISRAIKTSKDFREEAKTIQAPILYLRGKESYLYDLCEITIQFLTKNYLSVCIVEYEDGIHDLEFQKPREVSQEILKFLQI